LPVFAKRIAWISGVRILMRIAILRFIFQKRKKLSSNCYFYMGFEYISEIEMEDRGHDSPGIYFFISILSKRVKNAELIRAKLIKLSSQFKKSIWIPMHPMKLFIIRFFFQICQSWPGRNDKICFQVPARDGKEWNHKDNQVLFITKVIKY